MLISSTIQRYERPCRKCQNWPTFPQLFVDGELIGGCDIVTEMYEQGELQALIDKAGVDEADAESEAVKFHNPITCSGRSQPQAVLFCELNL